MIKTNEALKTQRQQSRDMPEEGMPATGGAEINAIAMPSQIEILRKEHQQKKDTMKSANLEKLYEKYGG